MSTGNSASDAAFWRILSSQPNEETPAWRSSFAGLAAMRLTAAWADGESIPAAGLRALQRAIHMMDVDAPERASLQKLSDELLTAGPRRESPVESSVLSLVRDYAEVLWHSGEWELAMAACQIILDRALTPTERGLLALTYNRFGDCLRASGRVDDALEAYETGRSAACARGDLAAELRLLISEASLEVQRGNVGTANRILNEVATEATHANLPALRARAVHDRGVILYQQGSIAPAMDLYLSALADCADDVGAERVLADIALAFMELGHLDFARTILLGLASHSVEHTQRSAAMINLLYIASCGGDEASFNSYRKRLARTYLTARHRAHYYLFTAEGFLRFDQPKFAHRALAHARLAIDRYQVRELTSKLASVENLLNGMQPASTRIAHTDSHSSEMQRLMVRTSIAASAWRVSREATLPGA